MSTLVLKGEIPKIGRNHRVKVNYQVYSLFDKSQILLQCTIFHNFVTLLKWSFELNQVIFSNKYLVNHRFL